jgi:hypothetical protein
MGATGASEPFEEAEPRTGIRGAETRLGRVLLVERLVPRTRHVWLWLWLWLRFPLVEDDGWGRVDTDGDAARGEKAFVPFAHGGVDILALTGSISIDAGANLVQLGCGMAPA